MSEYTTRQILDMIEANGGPEGLDLSGKDLRGIDLSKERIQAELEKVRKTNPGAEPAWVSKCPGGINLSEVNLQGADLREACLQGANLMYANLQEAILGRVQLQGACLTWARLQEAEIWRANLRGCILKGARLEGVEMGGTALQEACFWLVRLDHTVMGRGSLGRTIWNESACKCRCAMEYHCVSIGKRARKHDCARDAYLRLKQNFSDLGDYAASSWAYQKERQMEKACNAPWHVRDIYGGRELGDTIERRVSSWHPRVWRFYARHTLKWLSDWFVEYLCGYGESLSRVLFWMFASLFGFAAYYWYIGGVQLVEPNGKARIATSFWHYLIYSFGAFTTTEFARFQAADDRVRMVTAIQAIIGIVLAGLLGFVAGNRIRRS